MSSTGLASERETFLQGRHTQLEPLSNPHSDITDLGVLRKMLMGSLAFLLYWI